MNLYESLRPLLFFQRFFRFSLITYDKDGFKISRLAFIYAIIIAIATTVSYFSSISYGLSHIGNFTAENPFDPNSNFTTYLLAVPFITTFIAMLIVMTSTFTLRHNDLHFLQTLCAIDELLSHFVTAVNFSAMYRSFRRKNIAYILMDTVIVPLLLILISVYAVEQIDKLNIVLNFASYGSASVIIFFNVSTISFVTFGNWIRERLQLIAKLSETENFAEISDYLKLLEAEKLVAYAIDLMNGSFSIRQQWVLMADWTAITVQTYMLLVAVVFWNKDTFGIVVIMCSTLLPYCYMAFISSYIGHQLEIDVSSIITKLQPGGSNYVSIATKFVNMMLNDFWIAYDLQNKPFK